MRSIRRKRKRQQVWAALDARFEQMRERGAANEAVMREHGVDPPEPTAEQQESGAVTSSAGSSSKGTCGGAPGRRVPAEGR